VRPVIQYTPACKKAQDYMEAVTEDPMTVAYGAPVDEIMEDYMARHNQTCEKCREATIQASMP
jgi:hypothetical protein